MTPLASLAMGSMARVIRVHGDGEVSLRLLEMGLTPGVTVTMVGQAPLGDPLEFMIRGYRLSLRRSEAALVEVETN